MADGTDNRHNPLYDVPRKPEIAPRRKLVWPADTSENTTTSEKPLKPLVPPKKRRYTISATSTSRPTSSSTPATLPSTTVISSISVAETRQKLEQVIKDSAQPQKEPTIKPSTPIKVAPPVIPAKPPSFHSPSKPISSVPQSQRLGGQIPSPTVDSAAKNVSFRYVEVGTSKPPVGIGRQEAPDYAEPDSLVPRSSTSSYNSSEYSELTDTNKLVIKSKPFELEKFATEFPLPQIVRVYTGHYGITEQFSMSEGEELILFFIKSSKVVMASTQKKTETYHLPLNCSLQFGPYRVKSTEVESHSYHYETVEDLLKREEGLPKVTKVFKTFSGPSEEQSVMAGDLIFPQKVSGKKKSRVLKCKNKLGKKLKLGLNCAGDFSTDPSDVRMFLLEYIQYVNVFPVTALIFNEKDDHNKLSSLRTGTVLILEAPTPLRSYICSTDIFGERDYPIIELPMIMPIQIQCMERPGLDMQPIYSRIQHAYENFEPSMVKKSMFPAQNEREQQFYEEVYRDDGNSHLYDLERPEAIYEPIPDVLDSVVKKEIKMSCPILPSKPQKPPLSPSMKSPPLPPMNQTSPKSIEECSFPPQLPERPPNPVSISASPIANPPLAKSPPDQNQGKPAKVNISTVPNTTIEMTTEENKALLKAMNVEDILMLLDNMNLGEYKDKFQHEQVDGELMLELTKSDLQDLGITKNIHQIRLMKLIDGSSSVKKYADGLYGTLS